MACLKHEVKGQHLFNGIIFSDIFPRHILERISDFDLNGDILVASYPKTGTTWIQEIVWLICNNAATETAKMELQADRVKFLEVKIDNDTEADMDRLERDPRPRIIKTHLMSNFFRDQLAQGQVKVIIPVRNPKDTLVSFFNFYRMAGALGNFSGTWNEFFDMFKRKEMLYGDFFDWYTSWWEYKNDPNVLFLHYEALKKDLKSSVKKVAAFLGVSISDESVDKIVIHCSFDQMRSNKSVNKTHYGPEQMNNEVSPFMRKGKVGDWKNQFSDEQSQYIDELCKQKLEQIGLNIQYT